MLQKKKNYATEVFFFYLHLLGSVYQTRKKLCE